MLPGNPSSFFFLLRHDCLRARAVFTANCRDGSLFDKKKPWALRPLIGNSGEDIYLPKISHTGN